MCCFIHKVLIGVRKLCKMFIIYANARSAENGKFAGFHENLLALAKIGILRTQY